MLAHLDDNDAVAFIKPNWEDGPWIAGGAVLSWFKGEPVTTDFDVYFKTEKQLLDFYDLFKDDDIIKSELFTFMPVHKTTKNKLVDLISVTTNAVTFKYKSKYTIQLIKHTFYNSPKDIIDNFDISVCQLVTDGDTNLITGEYTIRDIKSNTFRCVNYRVEGIPRIVKYMSYGYRLLPNTLENFINIKNLDEDFKVGMDEYDY